MPKHDEMIKIIPVIDIKDGVAVAAKKGERDKYKPLDSVICDSSEPLKVAEAYKSLGFSGVYAADLNGILYSTPDIGLLEKINEIIPVIADIGVKCKKDALLMKNSGGIGIVIGTETLHSIDSLCELHESDKKNKNNNFNFNFTLSLDIKNGRLLNTLNPDLNEFIEKIAEAGIENRIDNVIILDLSQVGTLEGPNIELCSTVIKKLDNAKFNKKIIYGGGVRNISDIKRLEDAGIYAVLLGTAIHSGKIKISECKGAGIEV